MTRVYLGRHGNEWITDDFEVGFLAIKNANGLALNIGQ
jgi:hypothetical protein